MELWCPISRLENKYSVSSLGRVRNNSTKRVLKLEISVLGYIIVSVRPNGKNGGAICIRVHREVAIAFVPGYSSELQVNHIDADKTNNVISNLEWVTHQQNQIHARKLGLIHTPKGEKSHLSKLTNEQVFEIRNSEMTNAQLGRKFNVDRSAISKVRSRVNWKE